MNKAISIMIGALLLLPACASFETNAYKVIGTTVVTVDAAMNGWGDYVRAGKATPQEEGAVRFAYAQYQAALVTAKSAITAYRASKDKSALDMALDVLDATKNTLIEQILKAQAPQQ